MTVRRSRRLRATVALRAIRVALAAGVAVAALATTQTASAASMPDLSAARTQHPPTALIDTASAVLALPQAASPSPNPSAGGSATGGEGTADTQLTECQGEQDPQSRVFGITAASVAAGGATVAPDQRSRYSYGTLQPGAFVRDYVGFVNKSCFPVTLTIYAADSYNGSDGSVNLLPTGKPSKDIGAWITIGGAKTLTIAPRSTAIRQFVMAVPKNATPGDHLAALIGAANSAPAKTASGVPQSKVVTEYRVAARVEVRVAGELRPAVQITRIAADYSQGGNPLWGGSAKITYTVKNTGNVTVAAPQRVAVHGLLSGTTAIPNMPSVDELLPAGEATYTATAPNLFPLDLATASVNLAPVGMDGKQLPGLSAQVAETSFVAFSWLLLVLIVALLAGLAWYLWRRRRGRSGRRGPRPPLAYDDSEDGGSDDDALVNYSGGRPVRLERSAGAATSRRPAPHRRPALRRLPAALAVPALAIAAMAGLAAPAHAEDAAGTLTFLPAKGFDDDAVWAVTSAGCPAQTVQLLGLLNGGLFPKDTVALGSTTAGIGKERPFGIHLGDSFRNLAAANNVKLVAGAYTITVYCLDRQQTTVYRRFTGSVTFSDATHFTATAPAVPPAAGVPIGVLAFAYPKDAQLQAAAVAQGLTPASGAATPAAGPVPGATPAAAAGAGQTVAATAGSSPSGSAAGTADASAKTLTSEGDSTVVLVVAGLAVVGLLAGLRAYAELRTRRTVRRPERAEADDPDDADLEYAWPDKERE